LEEGFWKGSGELIATEIKHRKRYFTRATSATFTKQQVRQSTRKSIVVNQHRGQSCHRRQFSGDGAGQVVVVQ
jgi:hypothetical protein